MLSAPPPGVTCLLSALGQIYAPPRAVLGFRYWLWGRSVPPPPGQSRVLLYSVPPRADQISLSPGADLAPKADMGSCYQPQGQIWAPWGRSGAPPTSPGANLPPPRADQGSCYQPQGQNWAPGWQIWAPSPAALPPPRAAQCLCYHPDSPPAPSPPSLPRRSPLTSPRCYDGCIRATPPRRKSCRR